MKFLSIAQTRSAKQQKTDAAHGIFKRKIELNKYSKEEYDSMSTAQQQQLHELWLKTGLQKSKQTTEGNMTFKG